MGLITLPADGDSNWTEYLDDLEHGIVKELLASHLKDIARYMARLIGSDREVLKPILSKFPAKEFDQFMWLGKHKRYIILYSALSLKSAEAAYLDGNAAAGPPAGLGSGRPSLKDGKEGKEGTGSSSSNRGEKGERCSNPICMIPVTAGRFRTGSACK